MKVSANLGFLWTDLPLPDAIRAAAAAGFDAVECHWPYATPAAETARALAETGLPMLGLNTRRGDPDAGDNGLAALPGRTAEARAAIEEAIAYARAIGCGAVHVMAGRATGPEARAAYLSSLRHACAAAPDLMILIEPLNPVSAPGYFLNSTAEAAAIMDELAAPNLRLMFDFFHVQIIDGDAARRFSALRPRVGHVQIAAVPDRGPPDHGELDYAQVRAVLRAEGWTRPVGAEYRPPGPTEASLGWLAGWR